MPAADAPVPRKASINSRSTFLRDNAKTHVGQTDQIDHDLDHLDHDPPYDNFAGYVHSTHPTLDTCATTILARLPRGNTG